MRRHALPEPELPELHSERLVLRQSQPGSERETLDYFVRNRDHLAHWEPPVPAEFYTSQFWRRALARSLEEFRADKCVRLDFYDADAPAGPIIGRSSYSQISRGPFQSCVLGYSIDRAHQGRGLMCEGLALGLAYMFAVRRLHRVQASYQPHNERSARVLERLGFKIEGLAPQYLFIAGQWRDHVVTSLLNRDIDPEQMRTNLQLDKPA